MANPRYNSQVSNKRVAKKDGGIMKPVDKNKIPAGKKGAGLRALKEKAPEVAKKMGYMKKGGKVK